MAAENGTQNGGEKRKLEADGDDATAKLVDFIHFLAN